jgi:cell wall-associated NlpC family hydrolase
LVDAERAQVVREALSWLDTPFMWRQSARGLGCDCLTLLLAVYSTVEPTMPATPMGADYSPQEHLHRGEERYAQMVLQPWFDWLGITWPCPGDVVAFALGRRQVAHVGICIDDDGRFVSALATAGRVEVHSLREPFFARRYTGAWSLKRWNKLPALR